ncbi:MAG: hypothetical protein ABIF82_15390 [Planctomycetota bacterium]
MSGRVLAAIALCVAGRASPSSAAEPVPSPNAPAFRAECAALAKAAADADKMVVRGRGEWLFLVSELRHVSVGKFWGDAAAKVARARNPEHADPLPAIVDFNQQLKKLNIELILVPVAPKAAVYPEMVSAGLKRTKPQPRLDTQHQAFYKLLGEKGVTVLDIAPELIAHRNDNAGATYCEQDTHWSGRACVLTAGLIAKHIKGRTWLKDMPKLKLMSETREVETSGDLWQALKDDAIPKEKLPLRFVGRKTAAGIEPVEPGRNSPVLLLADSHGLVFHAGDDMHAKGAGLADQLALELGFAVDVLAVRGSGATSARISLYRRGRRDEGYIKGKKLIIWCFSAREFTETFTGWRKLPVVKREGSERVPGTH